MTEEHSSQRLGRRTDHIFLDQSPFAWAHRILAFVAGVTFSLTMIANLHLYLRAGSSRGQRGFGLISACLFLVGATPFLASYFENRAKIADGAPRLTIFLMILAALAVVVDLSVVLLIDEGKSIAQTMMVYLAQTVAYLGLGAILFPRAHRNSTLRT